MSWDAILFDFDETLAATRHLKALRDSAWRRGDDALWNRYFQNVQLAEPVSASDGTAIAPGLAVLADAGVPVAVVTSSPAESVRVWFTHHYGWGPPVVVGHGDASAKPHPDPLLLALDRLGTTPSPNVLSVGDDAKDVLAAHRAGITSATFHRVVPLSAAADVFLPTVVALGYWPTGSADDSLTDSPAVLVTTGLTGFDRSAVTNGAVLVGGRYIPEGGGVHDAIIEGKSGNWSPVLVGAASHLVLHAVADSTDPLLTSVPSREGEADRFQPLRSAVSYELGVAETATAIRWVKTVERLVRMGAEARRKAMANAFEASDVTGRKVVILDDVRTTGSTLLAAAKAVRTAGGDPVVVALTQTLSTRIDLPTNIDSRYEYPMVGTPRYEAWKENVRSTEELAATPRHARCSECGHPRSEHKRDCTVPRCDCSEFVA